ncbi:MAG TPA: cyclase family protein [Enhygromyxa sp.]|nr:cyclase family protein [Enhygromyxa sp.]
MKYIDLTQAFYDGLEPYDADWYPRFRIETVMRPDADPNGTTRTFTKHEIFPHNATHIESALHFFPSGQPIAKVPLEILVGPALVADLSHKRDLEPIDADDLERAVGDLECAGKRLLIRTDYVNRAWGRDDFWEKPPYLTPSAAQWIVDKKFCLMGLDCLTERPGDRASPVHITLLQHDIPIVEYLRNMGELSSREVFLVALPLLIEGVEATAARVIAIEGLSHAG